MQLRELLVLLWIAKTAKDCVTTYSRIKASIAWLAASDGQQAMATSRQQSQFTPSASKAAMLLTNPLQDGL